VASRDEILAFANAYLDLGSYPDYGPMGLQVVGAENVERIACGVSASLELFRRAVAAGAQLLIVHHGLFWDRDPRIVDRALRARLRVLFDGDLSLAAYHLALDAHPEVGNNVLLCRALGVEPSSRFAEIGFGGALAEPCTIGELAGRVEGELGRSPLVLGAGPERIERVAVCSGGAARYLADAAAERYDVYLTGEPAEPSLVTASEAGVYFVAAGHYATETLGIQALAATLADRFGIDWEFIDIPNPV
jgi:dinuclear metal center YbgI/SA1388 family protein